MVTELLADVAQEDLGEFGRILLYPIRPDRARTPLVRLPEGDRVRAIGGHLYPVSTVALTQAGWKDHYGPLWPAVESAKARFDPRHLLTPGQGMFAE
ncbi:hypothetical protein [Nonomuraea jabiensis]|uniref:hypothetical protein n=1 Tax=Nonomuraea jabiensis TaxID=882448 RepID=UPI003D70AE50